MWFCGTSEFHKGTLAKGSTGADGPSDPFVRTLTFRRVLRIQAVGVQRVTEKMILLFIGEGISEAY